MGSYLKTVSGEIVFNSEFYDEILYTIRNEASKPSWSNYGWVNEVKNAESLEDIFNEMDIKYKDVGNGWISCTVDNTYNSSFFGPMLECVAEYLDDSEMEVLNLDYDSILTIKIIKGNLETSWSD